MQIVFEGVEAIKNIETIIHNTKTKKAIVFKSKSSYTDSIFQFLDSVNIDICENIKPNPKYEDIMQSVHNFNAQEYQLLIAIGGGSVIDYAKAFKHYSKSTIPLVAIPTTAGTGSEATQFAVIYIDGVKNSLDTKEILPNYVILDSQFLGSASEYLKACSAMDAFAQAIESYWSVASTEESKEYARDAMTIIKQHIEPFVLTKEKNAQDLMQKGAYLAGKAINISRTTAAHALSYSITSDYGIPHGHAVSLSMSDLFEANQNTNETNCQESRGQTYVTSTMTELTEILEINKDSFRAYWQSLMTKLGLEYSFNTLHISNKAKIITSVNLDRLKNNPKDITHDLQNFWKF